MKILRIFAMVVGVMSIVGCSPMAANYHHDPLDKYVDLNLINAPTEKAGKTFWVNEYQHDDRVWKFKEGWYGLINITPRTQANVTLFVKEAIKRQFPDASFIADANKADIRIVIKRLRFYSGWRWVNVELKSEVNSKEIVFEERLFFREINFTEEEASNTLKKLASLLVEKIKGMGLGNISHSSPFHP
jgi:hypothetical protein